MSMLNLPGEFLKSGVSNVVSGGRRLVTLGGSGRSEGIQSKCTISVKNSPNKDAQTTASYAIKCGYVLKKNEQGVFHKRFVCTVPHLFLYYFENETSESPHGIIDLELLTKIEIESDNETIKLSTDGDLGIKPYYLQLSDKGEMNDWLSSLLRDRYNIVKEERDAYRQLQDQFTGEIESSMRRMDVSNQDMERLQRNVADAKTNTETAIRHIASALSIIGISEDEMKQLSTPNQFGNALMTNLRSYIQNVDQRALAEKQEFDRVIASYDERISMLEEQIKSEISSKTKLEQRFAREKREADQRVYETVNQMDQVSLNMQMAVAAKVAAETKTSQLNDQKKLLVKEVKQLRKKIEELNEQVAALTAQSLANQASFSSPISVGTAASISVDGIEKSGSAQSLKDDSDDEDVDEPIATDDGSSVKSDSSPHHSFLNMFAYQNNSQTTIKNNSQPALLADEGVIYNPPETHAVVDTLSESSRPVTPTPITQSMNAIAEDNSLLSSASMMKLQCLRCNGTVEGPKYSTCKCSVPALCQEDLDADAQGKGAIGTMFKGFVNNLGRRASNITGGSSENTPHSSSTTTNTGESPANPNPAYRRLSAFSGFFGGNSE